MAASHESCCTPQQLYWCHHCRCGARTCIVIKPKPLLQCLTSPHTHTHKVLHAKKPLVLDALPGQIVKGLSRTGQALSKYCTPSKESPEPLSSCCKNRGFKRQLPLQSPCQSATPGKKKKTLLNSKPQPSSPAFCPILAESCANPGGKHPVTDRASLSSACR